MCNNSQEHESNCRFRKLKNKKKNSKKFGRFFSTLKGEKCRLKFHWFIQTFPPPNNLFNFFSVQKNSF